MYSKVDGSKFQVHAVWTWQTFHCLNMVHSQQVWSKGVCLTCSRAVTLTGHLGEWQRHCEWNSRSLFLENGQKLNRLLPLGELSLAEGCTGPHLCVSWNAPSSSSWTALGAETLRYELKVYQIKSQIALKDVVFVYSLNTYTHIYY